MGCGGIDDTSAPGEKKRYSAIHETSVIPVLPAVIAVDATTATAEYPPFDEYNATLLGVIGPNNCPMNMYPNLQAWLTLAQEYGWQVKEQYSDALRQDITNISVPAGTQVFKTYTGAFWLELTGDEGYILLDLPPDPG